ncbi:DDE-type integrase/transposase/recombinase [Pontibacter mangrovi]|uniref:Integrase catalytic domain-containing protein n=1 Tax=Pontibacter mangrovi TaxID=2589816 RepID=A0A501VZH7_9BACT|nr:hypothetical protein FJM65_18480 [Pontibacter mangrovi]
MTYIRTIPGFSYLSLITDAYSRKIVGFALHPTLEADGCVAALRMALALRRKEMPFDLIHHSDRGVLTAAQNIRTCYGRRGFPSA